MVHLIFGWAFKEREELEENNIFRRVLNEAVLLLPDKGIHVIIVTRNDRQHPKLEHEHNKIINPTNEECTNPFCYIISTHNNNGKQADFGNYGTHSFDYFLVLDASKLSLCKDNNHKNSCILDGTYTVIIHVMASLPLQEKV